MIYVAALFVEQQQVSLILPHRQRQELRLL